MADSKKSLVQALTELNEAATTQQARPPLDEYRAHASRTDDGLVIVSEPYTDQPPDAKELLEFHGYDPEQWVVTSARSSRWQQKPEVWLEASRISFAPKHQVAGQLDTDYDAVVKTISQWRPRRRKTTRAGSWFVSPVGDTQIGKIEGGGTEATIARFLSELEWTVERQKRSGADNVLLPWLGDCIEGTVSQGGKVQGRLDIPITEQIRVYRRLVMAQIKAHASAPGEIHVVAIPGNHDEPSRQLFTVGRDSWAVEAIAAVEDGIRENPELKDRVTFFYPERDGMSVTMDVGGSRITMVHGHQFGSSRDYWEKWWDGQIRARQVAGDADVLLAAHRHHLRISDFGGSRLFVQVPAMDGGSRHFDDRHGGNSPSRLVSFTLDGGRLRDFDPVL